MIIFVKIYNLKDAIILQQEYITLIISDSGTKYRKWPEHQLSKLKMSSLFCDCKKVYSKIVVVFLKIDQFSTGS